MSIICFWILPVVLLGMGLRGLRVSTIATSQLVLAVLLPVCFGYIVVSIGAGVLGLWRWNIAAVVRGVPLHIGVYYAAYFVPVLALSLRLAGETRTPFVGALLAGGMMMVVGTLHDIVVRAIGAVTVPSRHRQHWRAVLSYSLQFFGWSGAVYGAAVFTADRYALAVMIPSTVVAMCAPFVAWFARLHGRAGRRLRA